MNVTASHLAKRSVSVAGHRTSIALEPAFWKQLEQLAAGEGVTLAALITRLDSQRGRHPLASALRLYVLEQLTSEGGGERR